MLLLMKIGDDVKREARIEEQRRKSKEDKLKRVSGREGKAAGSCVGLGQHLSGHGGVPQSAGRRFCPAFHLRSSILSRSSHPPSQDPSLMFTQQQPLFSKGPPAMLVKSLFLFSKTNMIFIYIHFSSNLIIIQTFQISTSFLLFLRFVKFYIIIPCIL